MKVAVAKVIRLRSKKEKNSGFKKRVSGFQKGFRVEEGFNFCHSSFVRMTEIETLEPCNPFLCLHLQPAYAQKRATAGKGAAWY